MALAALPAQANVDIQQVRSEKGITAWLVEDYSVPIVTIRFSFKGGNTQDPEGKEGLSELMSGLFDEGAGELDSDAFQIKLDDAGAEMRFGAERDRTFGSMRMLAEKKDEAFDLLKLAIQQPRFDAAPMDRIRAQIVSGIVANQRDPETAARVKWAEALYGAHPYARPDEGTEKSLATITADDLRDYHRRVFARDNLNVAVVGAIDAETVKRELDRLFGDLPERSDLRPVEKVDLKLDQEVRVDYDLPQTSLQLAYPGVPRDAPDFFAAYLMNHILGGGTFTSRLFDEVREKRGLAYGINSSLVTQEYASSLVIGTATRSDRAAETLGVIRDTVRRMAEEGPTEAELAAAKQYVIGAYALNNLDSSSAIASTLLSLQEEKLGIDYIDRRTALIEAVTLDEVKAAARKLLTADPAILVIGPPLEGTKG
ncbi:pitrilysin family protein [Mesorhizobium sp. YM1C-6-2]|uniref:M16 family metallopeptidase n=1 Tax=Mesorhizobium sp. YM1C-6-2 TaxID=1827501 RepID=UPI0032AF61B5